MLPNVYGFHWTAGHVIFIGTFFSVLLVILATVATAAWRMLRDIRNNQVETVRWLSDFHDLPARDRVCRHELTGEFPCRRCERGFDCRGCQTHAELAAGKLVEPAECEAPLGLDYPADRLYHRGHTWVREEEDGTLTVGLDDFATRLAGPPDQVKLPAPGEKLQANGAGWKMRRNGVEVRILAPVDGEVVATGGPDAGFYLKLKPPGKPDTRHLLRGAEIRPWLVREMERLQLMLSPASTGLSLADGGILVDDVPATTPEADWDAVWGELFLEP
jgi:Glycine cleavage H-protein